MSAARLISSADAARTPTSGLADGLYRLEERSRGRPGHFVAPGAMQTLCGIELPDAGPVAAVHCPRCLALALPGRPGDGTGAQ